MSMLWLTTALGVLMLLSLAVIAGILLLGTLVCLLSRGLDLLLSTTPPARPAPRETVRRPSPRNSDHSTNSWMLSA